MNMQYTKIRGTQPQKLYSIIVGRMPVVRPLLCSQSDIHLLSLARKCTVGLVQFLPSIFVSVCLTDRAPICGDACTNYDCDYSSRGHNTQ